MLARELSAIRDSKSNVLRRSAMTGSESRLWRQQTANHEAHETDACNVAFVMFSQSKPIAGMTVGGKPASILELTVQAFGNRKVWKHVPSMVQYTVAIEKGQVS